MKERKHLSVWGVGPVYGMIVLALTASGLLAARAGWLDAGGVPALRWPMAITGVVLLLTAAMLFAQAHLRTRLFDHVRQNRLVTTGVYAWVRNPVYSAAMLAGTGVLLMAHNLWLLLLPPVFWLLMTLMLIPTEERWLRALYGQEYVNYCARVNRCLPWFPRKTA